MSGTATRLQKMAAALGFRMKDYCGAQWLRTIHLRTGVSRSLSSALELNNRFEIYATNFESS